MSNTSSENKSNKKSKETADNKKDSPSGNDSSNTGTSRRKFDMSFLQLFAFLITFFGAIAYNVTSTNTSRAELLTEIRQLRAEILTVRTDIASIKDGIHIVDNRVVRVEDRLGIKDVQPLQVTAMVAPVLATLGDPIPIQVSFTNTNPFPMDSPCYVFLSNDDQPIDPNETYTIQLSALENRSLIFLWDTENISIQPGIHYITIVAKECPYGINKSSTYIQLLDKINQEIIAYPSATSPASSP